MLFIDMVVVVVLVVIYYRGVDTNTVTTARGTLCDECVAR